MSKRVRKIAKVIVEGLTLSARATAWREGMPWIDDRRTREKRTANHQ